MSENSHRSARPAARLSRRSVLGLAGAAAATTLAGDRGWVFALGPGHAVVVTPARDDAPWQPVFFSPEQAEAVALLAEHILPRTDTPGARDARVYEYIDLVLSIEEPAVQKKFLSGLEWLEKRCKKLYRTQLVEVAPEQRIELLRSISDERGELPRQLAKGAQFFAELKRRTVLGYYTSREGWVEELGQPEHVGMESWQGCDHAPRRRREGEHA